jgi:hypothetical protein
MSSLLAGGNDAGSESARARPCVGDSFLLAQDIREHVNDWSDVSALCERFGIPIPDSYRRFRRDSRSR